MVKTATEEAVKAHTQSTGFRFSAEGHALETGSQVLGDSGSSGIQNDHWRAPNPRDRMLLSLLRKACAFTGGRAGGFRSCRMPLTCKRWGMIAPDRADVVSHPGSRGTKCARALLVFPQITQSTKPLTGKCFGFDMDPEVHIQLWIIIGKTVKIPE